MHYDAQGCSGCSLACSPLWWRGAEHFDLPCPPITNGRGPVPRERPLCRVAHKSRVQLGHLTTGTGRSFNLSAWYFCAAAKKLHYIEMVDKNASL